MKNFIDYFKDADKVLRGLTALRLPLGLTHETELTYAPALADAKAKVAAFDDFRASKLGAYVGVRNLRPATDAFLRNVRNHLTGPLGDTHSAAWVPLGFADSLQLPRTDAGRCQMLEKLKAHFTGHPERENAAEQYTAARAEALCGPLTSAVVNVDNCKELGRTKKGQRATALRTLDRKTARVRNELEVLLDAKDPRWLKFFNRIPGDPRVPEPVENLTATAQPGGKILVDWDDAARAARYKVRKLVVGVDVEMVDADTVEDSDAVLENVPAGATVKLQIVPLNGAGAGVPSAVIEVRAA